MSPGISFVPTGIAVVDEILGGGFPRGFASLGAAPQGCGGTITACQLALGMAQQGADVIYVTTEKAACSARGISYRMLSSLGVPYPVLHKEGFKGVESRPEYRKPVEILQSVSNRIRIVPWPAGSQPGDFQGTLEDILYDNPADCLVFDGLDKLVSLDLDEAELYANQQKHRLMGSACASLAAKHDVAILVFTKLTFDFESKKRRMYDILFGAGVSEEMPVFFGISSVGAANRFGYARTQYWNFDKLRNAESQTIKVEQEFEYQRWNFPDTLEDVAE